MNVCQEKEQNYIESPSSLHRSGTPFLLSSELTTPRFVLCLSLCPRATNWCAWVRVCACETELLFTPLCMTDVFGLLSVSLFYGLIYHASWSSLPVCYWIDTHFNILFFAGLKL
jgi:hypothetical protein